MKRANVKKGTHQRARRPVTWEVLKELKGAAKGREFGGRIEWIGLATIYHLLLRVSKLYAENDRRVHALHCLMERGIAVLARKWLVELGNGKSVKKW